jgi:hypothetical protein
MSPHNSAVSAADLANGSAVNSRVVCRLGDHPVAEARFKVSAGRAVKAAVLQLSILVMVAAGRDLDNLCNLAVFEHQRDFAIEPP